MKARRGKGLVVELRQDLTVLVCISQLLENIIEKYPDSRALTVARDLVTSARQDLKTRHTAAQAALEAPATEG